MRKTILLGGVVFLVVAMVPAASATSGTLFITSDTTLTEDHNGSIVIEADSVTLDCAGFTVTGLPWEDGILVDGHHDVTIRNCQVTNALNGIQVTDAAGGLLEGNSVADNSGSGIRLDGSSFGNTLASNVATGNGLSGFILEGANHNILKDNHAIENGDDGSPGDGFGDGFTILGSSENVLERNEAIGNAWAGVYLQDSEHNLLKGNEARDNGLVNLISGFDIQISSENVLRGNLSVGNAGGFYTFMSRDNIFEKNVATLNLGGFILDEGSTGNTFAKNSATGNQLSGFLLTPNEVNHNRLVGNEVSANGENGFTILGSTENVFEKNLASGNRLAGFYLQDASHNVLKENEARENGLDEAISGFDLQFSSGNVLRGNRSVGNGSNGFYTFFSSGNTFEMNLATSNAHNGFGLDDGSIGNTFQKNLATGNQLSGFFLKPFEVNDNIFEMNQANQNGFIGFNIEGSTDNVFSKNQASLNEVGGFYLLFGSSGNTLTRNLGCRNGEFDAFQDDTSDNVWEANAFCTTEGI